MTSTGESSGAARRRGRPQKLPVDKTPITELGVGVDQRVAWLLSTNRLLAPDPELARREAFLKVLKEQGVQVDNTRVSRWESGLQAVPGRVVATYERVLGRPEGSLVSIAAGLRRSFGTGAAPREPSLSEADLTTGSFEGMLDAAERGDAGGAMWLRLAEDLHRFDHVFLRKEEWTRLCGRLVDELGVAVGPAYVRRYEAAATMLRHRAAQRPMLRAVGSFVVHPDTQVVAPVLNLLTELPDAPAGELVLRLLASDDGNQRRAAASVAAYKIARGHLQPDALPQLESAVLGALRRQDPLDGRLDFFDLAVHLPEPSWEQISGGLRTRRAFGMVTQARVTSELVPHAQTVAIVAELAATAQAQTPTQHSREPDPMLRRLLREALLHVHKARRHHAALVIAASPYAPAVAEQCLRLTGHPNDLLAARAWTVLMRVGHGGREDKVIRRARTEERPTIRTRALLNVGMARGGLANEDAVALADAVVTQQRPAERQATLFALGMQGATELKTLAEHENADLRRAAAWWRERGPAIHDADVPDVPDVVRS
ncbi:hypothetical protein GGQ22_04040 [Nocardioides sp. zg-579]|uniref:Uncharacterized protein n=1 Tax=Nocardioides marmotae TaxID=2663857 RepID=A0A6I3IYS3_9ACTN|nr:hypothetical protein [Nocardioides marmotae]MCR6030611.1 hypothetical protein [Gordonia jinghuaiqii]MTB94247.1 hypothetical protein [Nocardioides marmotae]QKE00526.1 hypothetical protein HPC71_05120 [Nocardioides marmotae]